MEFMVKTYDLERESYVFTKLIHEDDVGAMRIFSPGESFRAKFLHYSHMVYLSSCEDLVLMDNGKRQLVLYNPVTERVQLLPPTIIQPTPRSEMEKCDLFFNCTGFGKDKATGEIKIIRNIVIYYETLDGEGFKGSSNRYELYSLSTHSWREIEVAEEEDTRPLMSPWGSVFVNGTHYWGAYLGYGGWGIRSIDFTSESFSSLQRPPITTVPDSTFLVELEQSCLGCLFGFKLGGGLKRRRFQLWSRHEGFEEPEWVLLNEFVIENVAEPAGLIQGRFLFLQEPIRTTNLTCLYGLKVYDILEKKMQRLDLYDNTDGMTVVSYFNKERERATHLPDSQPLSTCNKKSWKRYWNEILEKEAQEEDEDDEEEEDDDDDEDDEASITYYFM